MEENNKDFMVLKAGYHTAINDVLDVLKDQPNFNLIKDRINRKEKEYFCKDEAYECILTKYYDKENNLGYILFDDIYELSGVVIFVDDKNYKKLEEKELIFIKNHYESMWSRTFYNEQEASLKYNEIIDKFVEI